MRIDWGEVALRLFALVVVSGVGYAAYKRPLEGPARKCERLYQQARTHADTLEVDRQAVRSGRGGAWNCGLVRHSRERESR